MIPGTIFISHRSEYAAQARGLKKLIESTSRGKISVFISEDIPRGNDWRAAIEAHLRDAERLFLIYGAPYEDWSWCFYEAGYFAGRDAGTETRRRIYCMARPDVPVPSPLNHLQIVQEGEQLLEELLNIYAQKGVACDAVGLRAGVEKIAKALFSQLSEYVSYPRVYFMADDAEFGTALSIPPSAVVTGEQSVLNNIFGIGKACIPWSEIADPARRLQSDQEMTFFFKWLDETTRIIVGARQSEFIAPQTVLIGRGGRRFRFLLYEARRQGDGKYFCEFLAIDDVGGPALGLSRQLLSLLTSIRMGFRFRYELIERFSTDPDDLADDERRDWIEDIPRILANLTTESETRGDIMIDDLLGAFGDFERTRIKKLLRYWPTFQKEMYAALGVSADGKVVSNQGLCGRNVERFRTAFDAMRLINVEFLSRCCAKVSGMMLKPNDELARNAKIIEAKLKSLERQELRPVA